MGNEVPWKKKTIGHYKVEFYKAKTVEALGKGARVKFNLDTYKGTPTLKIYPEWGPEANPLAKPHGLGKTLREHEQSHINDYVKIITNRQSLKSLTNIGYDNYMNHTRDLLNSCSQYQTDQRKRPNEPLWKECKKILGWK